MNNNNNNSRSDVAENNRLRNAYRSVPYQIITYPANGLLVYLLFYCGTVGDADKRLLI
jgi:hypothetical protein